VSAFGDALGAIKSVLVMETRLERMDRDVERLGGDLAGLREAIGAVDRRVTRIEGVMEGYGRATASAPRQPRLPRK
jgi:hypothetical protein